MGAGLHGENWGNPRVSLSLWSTYATYELPKNMHEVTKLRVDSVTMASALRGIRVKSASGQVGPSQVGRVNSARSSRPGPLPGPRHDEVPDRWYM